VLLAIPRLNKRPRISVLRSSDAVSCSFNLGSKEPCQVAAVSVHSTPREGDSRDVSWVAAGGREALLTELRISEGRQTHESLQILMGAQRWDIPGIGKASGPSIRSAN
jgi:hypothetical protein